MKTLVIGGTGTVGSQVVKYLLQQNQQVRVLSTSETKLKLLPKGVEGVLGNLEDMLSLEKAFEGISQVFLLNEQSQREILQGFNAVEAAMKAGVEKIVYQSIFNVRKAPHVPHFQPKIQIEDAIIRSGLNYTFVSPNNFYQNDFWIKEAISSYGIYTQPIGNIGLNRVDVRDVAEAATKALLSDVYTGQTIPLVGPDVLDGAATAHILSDKLGFQVSYAGNDLESWEKETKRWIPAWKVEDWVVMYRFFQQQGFIASKQDIDTLRSVLGREPIKYSEFVEEYAILFKGKLISA